MAYAAKIAFQDLGNDASGTIQVPSDIPNGYLIYNYNMCASCGVLTARALHAPRAHELQGVAAGSCAIAALS